MTEREKPPSKTARTFEEFWNAPEPGGEKWVVGNDWGAWAKHAAERAWDAALRAASAGAGEAHLQRRLATARNLIRLVRDGKSHELNDWNRKADFFLAGGPHVNGNPAPSPVREAWDRHDVGIVAEWLRDRGFLEAAETWERQNPAPKDAEREATGPCGGCRHSLHRSERCAMFRECGCEWNYGAAPKDAEREAKVTDVLNLSGNSGTWNESLPASDAQRVGPFRDAHECPVHRPPSPEKREGDVLRIFEDGYIDVEHTQDPFRFHDYRQKRFVRAQVLPDAPASEKP